MSDRCVFRGRERPSDDPPEHVWPQWLERLLKATGRQALHTLVEGDATVRKQWTAPGFDVTVEDVCKCCNNGWMSGLESAASQVLSPMILNGTDAELSPEIQTSLAVWAVKTAMMFERVHPDKTGIPTEHYGELYRDQTRPPRHTAVWIGRFDPSDPSLYYRFASLHPAEAVNDIREKAYASSFTVGQVCFLVFGHPIHQKVAIEYQEAGILRIYPVEGRIHVYWPPEAYLSYFGFIRLVESFGVRRSDF